MLPDILERNLSLLIVGTALSDLSEGLGFFHLEPKNQIWFLLEYAGITSPPIFTEAERKLLANAKNSNVLNDMYRQLFFEKKESALLKHRIGMTVINRRKLMKNEDDPDAEPTEEDVRQLIRKIDKYKPRLVIFLLRPEVFERAFAPLFPSANRQRGRQNFQIGESEVWLAGSTMVRKDADALETVFEEIEKRLDEIGKDLPQRHVDSNED